MNFKTCENSGYATVSLYKCLTRPSLKRRRGAKHVIFVIPPIF